MVAGPLATPVKTPDALTVIVRASEDCQPKSAVTSFVEPSLKVATALSWVELPIATTACDGVITTDSNVALAAPGNSAAALVAAAIFPVGLSEELATPAGRLIDPVAE